MSELQKISRKHYDKEISDKYGKVNTLKKDAQRKYVSEFPSLEQGRTINSLADLNAILMKLKPIGKYLDIGCGRGKDVIKYTKKGYDAKGWDISKIQVTKAKEKLKEEGIKPERIEWIDALKKIPSFQKFFDIINSAHVYQHFTTEEALTATKNALHMLKDDGIMIIIVKINLKNWDEYKKKGVKIEVEDKEKNIFKMWDDDLGVWRPGYHLFYPKEIEKIINDADGEIIKIPTYKGMMKGIVRHDSGRNYPCIAYYIKKKG